MGGWRSLLVDKGILKHRLTTELATVSTKKAANISTQKKTVEKQNATTNPVKKDTENPASLEKGAPGRTFANSYMTRKRNPRSMIQTIQTQNLKWRRS